MLEVSSTSTISDISETFLDTLSATDSAFIASLWCAPALSICAVTADGAMIAANDTCIQYVGTDWRGQPLKLVLTAVSPEDALTDLLPARLPLWQQPLISYKRTNVLHLVGARHVLPTEGQPEGQQRQATTIAAWQLMGAGEPVLVLVFSPDEQLEQALDSLEHALEAVSKQALADMKTLALDICQRSFALAMSC